MRPFREFDVVRVLAPLSCQSNYSDLVVQLLPGKIGTIIDVLGQGTAFEVDIMLQAPTFGADGEPLDLGNWAVVTLTPDQVELVEPAPAQQGPPPD